MISGCSDRCLARCALRAIVLAKSCYAVVVLCAIIFNFCTVYFSDVFGKFQHLSDWSCMDVPSGSGKKSSGDYAWFASKNGGTYECRDEGQTEVWSDWGRSEGNVEVRKA